MVLRALAFLPICTHAPLHCENMKEVNGEL